MPTVDELIDLFPPPQERAQQFNSINGSDGVAGASLALKTSKQSGIPPEVTNLDPKSFAEDEQRRRNAQVLASNDVMASFLAERPVTAEAVHDDYDKLDTFSKTLEGFKSGWTRGKLEEIRGNIGVGVSLGLGGDERAAEIEREVGKLPEFKSGSSYWAQAVAGMMSSTLVDLGLGGPAGLAAGAVGAAGGPVGAGIGFVGGTLAGMGAAMGASARGRSYLDMRKMRDENGRGLTETELQIGSGLVGVATGAIGMLGLKSVANQEIASAVVRDAVTESMKNPTFRGALVSGTTELAKGGVTGAAMMGSITAIQEGIIDATKSVSDRDWKTLTNDPKRRQEVVQAINHAMVEGAVLVGGLHTPGLARNFVVDSVRIQQAKRDASALDAALAAAKDTETATRSPEALSELVRHQLGEQQIGLSIEAVDKVLKSDPAALESVPDLQRQVTEARASGGDVTVPVADFLAMPEALRTALKEDIRHREDGLTLKEAKELEESPPDYAAVGPQTVRFYHGGDEPTSGGSRFATTDPEYARNFRSEGEAKAVHYVDIPYGDPTEVAARAWDTLDESSKTNMVGVYKHIELPEGWAKQLKPYDATANAVIQAAARERRANWLDPLLRPDGDKPPLGMTEAEYGLYSQKLERLAAATERKAEALATREVKRREGAEWKRNLKEITDEVRNDLTYEPRFLADNYFRDGVLGTHVVRKDTRLKLDRAAVEAILGSADQLPKGYTVAKGGVLPDQIASNFGYASGQRMLTDLMGLYRTRQLNKLTPRNHFDQVVTEEAARRMEERHGRLDENIAREAQEMVVQQAQTEVLGAELEFLAKQDGQLPIDRQSIEAAAHELYANMPLERASDFKGTMRAVERMGRAAEMALLRGDTEAAFLAKQRQYQALLFAQSAKYLEKEVAGFQKLAARNREQVRPSVDQAYLDQIHGIMGRLGIPSKRNPAELQSALDKTPLLDFVQRKIEERGDLPVASFLVDGTLPEFGQLSVEQFHGLHDSLKVLEFAGKAERKVTRFNEQVELQALIDRANEAFAQFPTKSNPFNPGVWDRTKRFGRQVDVALDKAEQVFQWLDRNDPTGVFTETFRTFADAKYKEHDMTQAVSAELKKLKGSKEFQKGLGKWLDNDTLMDWHDGGPMRLNGRDLVAIMLHMGTESNFNKLTAKFPWRGELRGWDRADVEAFVNANATKEHWDLVKGIWKVNEEFFWPKIEEHSRRLVGIAPAKQEARKIATEFGEVEGGYAPLDRDPRWPHRGGSAAEGLWRETQFRNAIPKQDYALDRTEATYPVWIDYESVFNGMRETIHDLAYREPLLDGVKFLRHPEIREGIQQVFGKEYADATQPWLEHMAKGKLMDDATLDGLSRFARWSRHRLVMVELIGRLSTLFKHTGAAAFDSIGEVAALKSQDSMLKAALAPAIMAGEMMKLYGNVPSMMDNIRGAMERSGELRSRWNFWDRDVNEMAARNLFGERDIRAQMTHIGSFPLAMFDMATAVPVFTIAERHYLDKGFDSAQASAMADTVVRNAHGSAGRPDLAPIMRANEGVKLLTVAYTFFNHNYNRVRNIGRETVEGTRSAAKGEIAEAFGHYTKAALLSTWYIALMGLYERWVTHGGLDEDNEESVSAYALKGIGTQLGGNFPGFRDIAVPLIGWMDGKNFTPGGPFSSLSKATLDITKTTKGLIDDDELKGNWWAAYARGLGYGFGIPGAGQAAVTGQFLWDLDSGRQYADEWPSFIRGIAMGKSHPHERVGR